MAGQEAQSESQRPNKSEGCFCGASIAASKHRLSVFLKRRISLPDRSTDECDVENGLLPLHSVRRLFATKERDFQGMIGMLFELVGRGCGFHTCHEPFARIEIRNAV